MTPETEEDTNERTEPDTDKPNGGEHIGGIRVDNPTDFGPTSTGAPSGPRLKKDGTPDKRGTRFTRPANPSSGSAPSAGPNIQIIREQPKKAIATDKDAIDGVAGILLALHLTASAYFKVEELQLTEDEADKLARAMTKVAKQYDIETTAKAAAWMNLAYAASSIYGTRIYALVEAKREKEKKVA